MPGWRETLTSNGRSAFIMEGRLASPGTEYCPSCNGRMHVHVSYQQKLRHVPIGWSLTKVRFNRTRYYCLSCGRTRNQPVPFKAAGHLIIKQLEACTEGLLEHGLTLKGAPK